MTRGIVIQARTSSSRLPNKVFAEICGLPLISHVIERVSHATTFDEIILATTRKSNDFKLAEIAKKHSIAFFQGDAEDVLKRYYEVARSYKLDIIIRVTADDPFKDPRVLDDVAMSLNEEYDYASNTLEQTYPEGLDIETFHFSTLEKAHRESTQKSHREHVTPYIWSNPEIFKLKNVASELDLSRYRLTVDTPEDLTFARAIYECLYTKKKVFLLEDIMELLNSEETIFRLMPDIERNIGLKLSESND